jgi:hypothetical protein
MAAANAVDPEPKITKSNLCDEGMNHRRDHTSGIRHPDAGTASKIPHAIATQAKKWKAVLMFGTQPSLTVEDRGRSFSTRTTLRPCGSRRTTENCWACCIVKMCSAHSLRASNPRACIELMCGVGMRTQRFDLVILGSGSTAFAAAIRAVELGQFFGRLGTRVTTVNYEPETSGSGSSIRRSDLSPRRFARFWI